MPTEKKTKDQWYYVVVQNPETPEEELMGFETKEIPEPFIPAFKSKEEAQQCFLVMPKDIMNKKYEVHAIIEEDLLTQAKKNGYKIMLMDDKSNIKQTIKLTGVKIF